MSSPAVVAGAAAAPLAPAVGWRDTVLLRHGRRPLRFHGRLLLGCRSPSGWPRVEIQLYEMNCPDKAGNGWAAAILCATGGEPWRDALVAPTPVALAARLRAFQPFGFGLTAPALVPAVAAAWRLVLSASGCG
jgi:hypothetical protein